MESTVDHLAEQAKQFAREQLNHGETVINRLYSSRVFERKYADLLIRDCIKMLEQAAPSSITSPRVRSGWDASIAQIKSHYGVD